MIKIILDSSKNFDISHCTVLDSTLYKSIRKEMCGNNSEDILDVSYFLRSNHKQTEQHLDMVKDKCSATIQQVNLKIQRIGLMKQNGLGVKVIIEVLKYSNDKRIEFLRGIFSININLFDGAQFSIEKIGHKNGLKACSALKYIRNEMAISDVPIVKCYYGSRNWNSFDQKVEIKLFYKC